MPNTKRPLTLGLFIYNGESHVREALDNILAQTYGDFELIIADNASTDETGDICRDYAARDPRIRYHRQPRNVGQGPNLNWVFEQSSTRYFKWVCHDDRYSPTFLERCVEVLDRDPGVAVSHTDTGFIDQHGGQLRYDSEQRIHVDFRGLEVTVDAPHICEGARPEDRFRDVLHKANGCFHIYGVIRSDMLRKVAWRKNYFGHDKVILAELALLGRFQQIDEILFFKRLRQGQSLDYGTKELAMLVNPDVYSGNAKMLMLRDYFAAVRRTPLNARQRLHMYWTLARLVRRPSLFRHIFVPGQGNYLGIGSRRPTAWNPLRDGEAGGKTSAGGSAGV